MKILILSDPSSPHTIRWVNELHKEGITVCLFGLSNYNKNEYHPEIEIRSLRTPDFIKAKTGGSFVKIFYLLYYPQLKKLIAAFKPDIVHAHYAASYGVISAMSGFSPSILSVWGIDILTFPHASWLHRSLIKYSLKKTDYILATSNFLKEETAKIYNTEIQVTPFGVDTKIFRKIDLAKNENEVTLGIVKSLESKYGIDLLINIFAKLKNEFSSIRLLIVGGGSLESRFRNQARQLGIENSIEFTGRIPEKDIANYHNKIDIAVYLSSVESFGVSVLESSACEIPVVASDLGGLKEVVVNRQTGYLVNRNDEVEVYSVLKKLVSDKNLRTELGSKGRKFVIENYSWDYSFNKMINIYKSILDKA